LSLSEFEVWLYAVLEESENWAVGRYRHRAARYRALHGAARGVVARDVAVAVGGVEREGGVRVGRFDGVGARGQRREVGIGGQRGVEVEADDEAGADVGLLQLVVLHFGDEVDPDVARAGVVAVAAVEGLRRDPLGGRDGCGTRCGVVVRAGGESQRAEDEARKQFFSHNL